MVAGTSIEFSPTQRFLEQPVVITGTQWKLEGVRSNLGRFAAKWGQSLKIGNLVEPIGIPVTVVEKDEFVSQFDLVIRKAQDQAHGLAQLSAELEQTGEDNWRAGEISVPGDIAKVLMFGGILICLSLDTAASRRVDAPGTIWQKVRNVYIPDEVRQRSKRKPHILTDFIMGTWDARLKGADFDAPQILKIESSMTLVTARFEPRAACIRECQAPKTKITDMQLHPVVKRVGLAVNRHPLATTHDRYHYLRTVAEVGASMGLTESETIIAQAGKPDLLSMEYIFISAILGGYLGTPIVDVDRGVGKQFRAFTEVGENRDHHLFTRLLLMGNTGKLPNKDGFIFEMMPSHPDAKKLI